MKKKYLKPSLPNYIPKDEAQQLIWLGNYKAKLPVYGPLYGLSEASIQAAIAAIEGLEATLLMLKDIRTWFSGWVLINEELQYDKPVDGTVVVEWPKVPVWLTLPPPIKVNAWQPIIETTKFFLSKPNLTALDRAVLMLNPAEPSKRLPNSAEQYDYPLLALSESGGSVVVRTKRGKKYEGKMARYVIDYNNDGTFVDLAFGTNKDVLVPIHYPAGVSLMTWTICAVYMDNGQEASQWCPPVSIVLRNGAPPMALQEVDPQALERSVQNLLNTMQTQPQPQPKVVTE